MPELEVLSALIYDTALDPQAWPAAPTSPPTNPFASTSAIDLRRTAVDPRTRPQPGAPPRDSPSEGQNPRQRRDARAEKRSGYKSAVIDGTVLHGRSAALRGCIARRPKSVHRQPAPSAGWRTGPEASAGCIKFGRKPKLSDFQRQEALKRRAAGEKLAEIAKSYAVDISMISRLAVEKA